MTSHKYKQCINLEVQMPKVSRFVGGDILVIGCV